MIAFDMVSYSCNCGMLLAVLPRRVVSSAPIVVECPRCHLLHPIYLPRPEEAQTDQKKTA